VRAVQVGGRSKSGGMGFGKLWAIVDISNPRLGATTFEPDDPDYNPDDRAMTHVCCRV
jgi:hypothetical protein